MGSGIFHQKIGRVPESRFRRFPPPQRRFRGGDSPGFMRHSSQRNPGLANPAIAVEIHKRRDGD
jgi:hypothetical protein